MKIDINKVKKLTGMTLQSLSKQIGVSAQTLTDLKRKDAPKQICYIYKLSELAGVSVNDLIIEDEQQDNDR